MLTPVLSFLTCVTLLALLPAGSSADPGVGARIVQLRSDCPVGDDNCLTDTTTLTSWIGTTRQPDENEPLLVMVGAGDFDPFVLDCGGTFGHTSVRGSGPEQTSFKATGSFEAAIDLTDCEAMGFADIATKSNFVGARFTGTGGSTWTNVWLTGATASWFDECPVPGGGLHYFFSSRLISVASAASTTSGFVSSCSENWIFASDVASLADPTAPPASVTKWDVVNVNGEGDVRVFGSVLRAVVPGGVQSSGASSVRGAAIGEAPADAALGSASTNGVFHMHGGIISLNASGMSLGQVRGLQVSSAGDSSGHVVETAFALKKPTGGSARRLSGKLTTPSPFLWPSGDTPPDLISNTGSDLFVETDCSSTDCSGAGKQPHLMIYSEPCEDSNPGNPWFDTVRGECRD